MKKIDFLRGEGLNIPRQAGKKFNQRKSRSTSLRTREKKNHEHHHHKIEKN